MACAAMPRIPDEPFLLLFSALAAAPAMARGYDSGLIPPPAILLPDRGSVRSETVLLSDSGGWSAADAALAESLRRQGAIVVGIDLPTYLRALDASTGSDCLYLVADIEKLSHQVQRTAGNPTYLLPVVAGIGAGGTLALAIAAQTPAATIGGTVAVDPSDGITLSRDLCTTATRRTTATGTVYDLTPGALPDPVTVVFTPSAPAAGRDHVDALARTWPAIRIRQSAEDSAAALAHALPLPADDAAVDALPLTVLDARPAADEMAVIFSGDGGWRDLDKTIGEDLQSKGVPTVGIDSLRYFWSEKTPAEVAADLTKVIDEYRARWGVSRVILAGYSFGADILPATYLALDPAHQAAVTQLSLLGLAREAAFQISVADWLGLDAGSRPTLGDLDRIDPAKLQCFYGTKESDTACPDLGPGADIVRTEGGHHFDGDYAALADRILTGPPKEAATD